MKDIKIGQHVRHWHTHRRGWVMHVQASNKTCGVYWAETGSTSWTGWENLRESTEREFCMAMAGAALLPEAGGVP